MSGPLRASNQKYESQTELLDLLNCPNLPKLIYADFGPLIALMGTPLARLPPQLGEMVQCETKFIWE